MEIKPCKDGVISILAVYLVIFLCELGLLFASKFNLLFVIGILLLNMVLCFVLIRDLIYLYRTITLGSKGCTFSVGKWSKRYAWCDLKVQLCGDKHFKFNDAEISGPGVLICPKAMKYSGRIPYMTSCRYKKPFSSVYIRFKSSVDENKVIYGKVVYYGYTAEQEAIMDYLKSIDISLHQ